MSLDANGHLGIGTTPSSSFTLDVNGSMNSSASVIASNIGVGVTSVPPAGVRLQVVDGEVDLPTNNPAFKTIFNNQTVTATEPAVGMNYIRGSTVMADLNPADGLSVGSLSRNNQIKLKVNGTIQLRDTTYGPGVAGSSKILMGDAGGVAFWDQPPVMYFDQWCDTLSAGCVYIKDLITFMNEPAASAAAGPYVWDIGSWSAPPTRVSDKNCLGGDCHYNYHTRTVRCLSNNGTSVPYGNCDLNDRGLKDANGNFVFSYEITRNTCSGASATLSDGTIMRCP